MASDLMANRTSYSGNNVDARLAALESQMARAETRDDDADAKLEALGRYLHGLLRTLVRILKPRDKRTEVLQEAVAPTWRQKHSALRPAQDRVVPLRQRRTQK